LEPTKSDEKPQLPFKLIIEDLFVFKDGGIVVTGIVESGNLRTRQIAYITGKGKPARAVRVAGISLFSRPRFVDRPEILLRDIHPDQIEVGMLLTTEPAYE
jgi:translation elongation factor EF-Tu-like GTPase